MTLAGLTASPHYRARTGARYRSLGIVGPCGAFRNPKPSNLPQLPQERLDHPNPSEVVNHLFDR